MIYPDGLFDASLYRDRLYHAVLTSISMAHNFFNAPLGGYKRWQIDRCPWFFSASQQTRVINWPLFHSAISQTDSRNLIILHNSEVIGQEDLWCPTSHLPPRPLSGRTRGPEGQCASVCQNFQGFSLFHVSFFSVDLRPPVETCFSETPSAALCFSGCLNRVNKQVGELLKMQHVKSGQRGWVMDVGNLNSRPSPLKLGNSWTEFSRIKSF